VRFLGGAVEDGVLECLGGILASGARSGGVAVPGRVGAEVAFPRSHLVKAARGELVQAHEQVGLERGAVWVSSWVRCSCLPFFHEEIPPQEFNLGVGAARGGLGVVIDQQMLGGNGEGTERVRAQEKQH